MLTTFVEPRPKPVLIRVLEPVNRLFNLTGIPILRDTPLIKAIPGIRGLTNITQIDFPDADVARMRAAVNQQTAAFLVPNHPEFYCDWMVDKEVMARLSVDPGCWATHNVVNGMGKWGQKFWLANNLIAQIPGDGGTAAKDYSVALAKRGDGILLHPEGTVHWVSDQVGTLFPGAFDMARQTATELEASSEDRPVYVVPLIYKYRFLRDETANLRKAMSYLENGLDLPESKKGSDLSDRLGAVQSTLMERCAAKLGLSLPTGAFWDRRAALMAALTDRLAAALTSKAQQDDPYQRAEDTLRQFTRARREDTLTGDTETNDTIANELRELLRLQPWMYPDADMTQEQIAESIQRLRCDWLKQGFWDKFHAFIPQPVGPRCAHIRVIEPIKVGSTPEPNALEALRTTMQHRLDDLNREIAPRLAGPMRKNPFLG